MEQIEEKFKLEIGKQYLLRNGLITSPLRKSSDNTNYRFEADVDTHPGKGLSILSWLPGGKYLTNLLENYYDIIEIWKN